MNAQRSFDFPAGLYRGKPGHAKGSDTSREAAERVTRLNERQQRVLTSLRRWGPATVWEFMDRHGIEHTQKDSWAPRFSELRRAKQIAKHGRRPSPHGRSATVWRAIPNTESEAA